MTRAWRARAAQSDNAAPLLDRVLAARGLTQQADSFMNPSLKALHEPKLIPDLQRAADRIIEAVKNRETIAIFGDYDVDGVTASAILIHTLRAIDPQLNIISYIPHRVDEGYGLNCDAIRELHSQGVSLVVSVDCGITAHEPA
ncbi:MAG TPA: single-stranded-DNA-specific exonuclease RecJ, partial [Phycisphaerales bacterium]|nr:single-stranded-DNA-specific exonuclease RecJ [Phycisphaerales bacterium]